MKLAHDRRCKATLIGLDIGDGEIGITEWEKEAIKLMTLGLKQNKLGEELETEHNQCHMRLLRLSERLAPLVGIKFPATIESILIRTAYLGGLVRL